MSLLGEDGRGYELARKLETLGVWRTWLGDSVYGNFIHFLSTPSTWNSFMNIQSQSNAAAAHDSRALIHLQLRARALLFDKASISLFHPSSFHDKSTLSKLNPNYLQLHGDDVYFTLENCNEGVSGSSAVLPKVHSKSNFGVGSRYSESEADAMSQRLKLDDLPETWYDQFFEKYRASKSYRLQFGDKEAEKRTPEQMAFYLRIAENHKRRRIAFESNSSLDNDNPFFPETMSAMNCVPESAVPQRTQLKENLKVEFNGVLDTLPQIITKSPSPIMIERLGIRPEYLSMEQGGNQNLGKSGVERTGKCLSQEQALKLSQKVMAQLLGNVGFEGSSEVPLEVLTKFLSCHICKLGGILKLLADSYRKQCSAMELLKMFLRTSGHSNLAALSELVKDNTRKIVQQTQQVQGFQQQMQPQHQAAIRQQQQQQILRMHPQIQQMLNSQNLTPQQLQQLERMRRRQQLTPRPGMSMNMNMNMDKDRPMVEVKLEHPTDLPMDSNAFNSMTVRQPQMQQPQMQQFRQQQIAAMSSPYAQNTNQFRPMASLQIPQVHSPNMGMARAPPVKVEGFQELMGGDASMKHDSEENKLMSPQK